MKTLKMPSAPEGPDPHQRLWHYLALVEDEDDEEEEDEEEAGPQRNLNHCILRGHPFSPRAETEMQHEDRTRNETAFICPHLKLKEQSLMFELVCVKEEGEEDKKESDFIERRAQVDLDCIIRFLSENPNFIYFS